MRPKQLRYRAAFHLPAVQKSSRDLARRCVVLKRHRSRGSLPCTRVGVLSFMKFPPRLMGCTVHARKLEAYHHGRRAHRGNVLVPATLRGWKKVTCRLGHVPTFSPSCLGYTFVAITRHRNACLRGAARRTPRGARRPHPPLRQASSAGS